MNPNPLLRACADAFLRQAQTWYTEHQFRRARDCVAAALGKAFLAARQSGEARLDHSELSPDNLHQLLSVCIDDAIHILEQFRDELRRGPQEGAPERN
ncbi:MAG: hypothetical protein JO112_16565 [Planctomycetes bacterium]|nr:hypothetical protein [Planctomycetota bacterium]